MNDKCGLQYQRESHRCARAMLTATFRHAEHRSGPSEGQFELSPFMNRKSVATLQLLRGAKKDRTDHGFNPDGHLLSGDTVGGLKPAAGGSENGPGRGGRE